MYGTFYETSDVCMLITICLTGLGYLTFLNMAHQIEDELQGSGYATIADDFLARQRRTLPMTTTHIQNLTIGWSTCGSGIFNAERAEILSTGGDLVDSSDLSPQSLFDTYARMRVLARVMRIARSPVARNAWTILPWLPKSFTSREHASHSSNVSSGTPPTRQSYSVDACSTSWTMSIYGIYLLVSEYGYLNYM